MSLTLSMVIWDFSASWCSFIVASLKLTCHLQKHHYLNFTLLVELLLLLFVCPMMIGHLVLLVQWSLKSCFPLSFGRAIWLPFSTNEHFPHMPTWRGTETETKTKTEIQRKCNIFCFVLAFHIFNLVLSVLMVVS